MAASLELDSRRRKYSEGVFEGVSSRSLTDPIPASVLALG